MSTRENEVRKNSLRFNANEIILAVDMIEKLEKTMDVVYYLMEHEDVESIVLLLITAQNLDMLALLEYEKRDTDILFEVNKEKATYVMLCQDTKVDGGYHFAERIIENIVSKEGTDIYCAEVEVRSTRYKVKNVIFKLIETFMKAKAEKLYTKVLIRGYLKGF